MNKYTKNVLYSWGDNLAKIAVQFLSIPIILNNLGKDEYGIWITIGGAATFLNLLDFGIANSITRFFARNLGSKKENENSQATATGSVEGCDVQLIFRCAALSDAMQAALRCSAQEQT